MTKTFIAIIVFKYFKAALFLLVGLGMLSLARTPPVIAAHHLARIFRSDPESELIRRSVEVLRELPPGEAIGIGVIAVAVGLVFATEGSLLTARIWWSTYFTITLTAMGIPLEIFEIVRRPASVRRYVLLAVNVAILIYLWAKRNEFRDEPEAE